MPDKDITDSKGRDQSDPYQIDGHKLDLHLDRVREWQTTGDAVPVYIEISPTAQCNHSCTFCALDYINHAPDRIRRVLLEDIGTQLARLGVRGVMFGGEGEPTLHPDLPEVLAHYKAKGIDTALTTNGTGLDELFLVEGGEWLKWVKISMNGGDEETYAKVHRCPTRDWVRVWTNIWEFRQNCLHRVPTIGIQAVAIPENLASLPELCARAVEANVDYVVIKPFSPNAYSQNRTQPPDYGELARACALCVKEERSNSRTKVIIRDCAISSLVRSDRYPVCLSVPYFWFYINSKAEVIACPNHMLDNRFRLGNLDDRSLQEIWTGDGRRGLKDLMRGGFDIGQCRKACRMDRVNEWLWKLENPGEHRNFI